MVATQSSMLDIGTLASDFQLNDGQGKSFSLEKSQGKPFLIMFICNHCPYVIHVIEKLVEIAKFAEAKGIPCFAINSNDIKKYPADSPYNMIKFAEKHAFNFPYLFDEKQEVAKAYKATCTPDFFLYDKNHKLFYRGQMDDSRPGNNKPITGNSLLQAIKDVLKRNDPPKEQKPSIGCNIKWKT